MKSFSVECSCTTKKYETEFLPLLRRMSNLEELTLNIWIRGLTSFIDGPQIKNDILVRLPRLSKFFILTTRLKRTPASPSIIGGGYPTKFC